MRLRGKAVKIFTRAAAYLAAVSLIISLPVEMSMLRTVYGQDVPPVKIDIFEYANMAKSSSVYALTGEVLIEGGIPDEQIVSESLMFYLDDNSVPFARMEKADMIVKDGKRTFSIPLDTSLYAEGTHSLSAVDGEVVLLETEIYISQKTYSEITNVNKSCNMRSTPSTDLPTVISVPLAAKVDVLGSVKGQLREEYYTDIWYLTRYTAPDGKVYEGYIISALVSVNSILDISFSAEGMLFEKFSTMKNEYDLFVPESVAIFSIDMITRLKKENKLSVSVNGNAYSGLLNSIPLSTGETVIEVVCLASDNSRINGYKFRIRKISDASHNAFLLALENFPESYREQLMTLHSMYPEWVFEPFETGLKWNDVIDNQDKGTNSLIEKSVAPEYKLNDIIEDSSSFVRASRAAVEYYIDPRNFLNPANIFMFEKLYYNKNIHSTEGIKYIIGNSGLIGKESMFFEAGIQTGINPYHLVARSLKEVTVWSPNGLSPIATGNFIFEVSSTDETALVEDKRYKGFYNFYNIGTASSTNITLLYIRGLDYAKGNERNGRYLFNDYFKDKNVLMPFNSVNENDPLKSKESTPKSEEDKNKYGLPWDTELKAIVGGAKFIGNEYVNIGQNTPYLQKFDLIGTLYTHQYMQNIRAPIHESSKNYSTYKVLGDLHNDFVFRIPIYLNMPEHNIPLPEKAKLLESIEVAGHSLFPVFDPSIKAGYKVSVPADYETISIAAEGFDSRSQIWGTGEVSLEYGENLVKISCLPPNGEIVDYTITVTRMLPEKSADNYLNELSMDGISLDRIFKTTDTNVYKAEVRYDFKTARINAIARSENATVEGAGIVDLKPGINEFSIKVTSENGKMREYRLSINRVIPQLESNSLVLSDGVIKGIDLSIGATVGYLETALTFDEGTVEVFNKNGDKIEKNTFIGTGSRVKFFFEREVIKEYNVLIYGDINGDGKLNSSDLSLIMYSILKLRKLEGEFLLAADVNKDGKVNSSDLTILQLHILKLKAIEQTN